MNAGARHVQRVYLVLLLLHTLAASFIWGINTLFLLDAGLTNAQAFAANAFFTAGLVLFEVPTGVVADMRGRRLSYLLGTLTLAPSTLLYLLMWRISAPFGPGRWPRRCWARLHLLLGRRSGLARRCAHSGRLRRAARTGLRPRRDRRGRGDARRIGAGRLRRADDQSRRAVRASRRGAGAEFRDRVSADARRRLHAQTRRRRAQSGQGRAARRDAVRLRQPPCALGDVRQRVHRWRVDLRVLCDAALPARLVRRSESLWRRRAVGRHRRRRADRGRPARLAALASRSPPYDLLQAPCSRAA